jgi:hypothetical protein
MPAMLYRLISSFQNGNSFHDDRIPHRSLQSQQHSMIPPATRDTVQGLGWRPCIAGLLVIAELAAASRFNPQETAP